MAGSIFIPLKAIFDNKGIKNAQAEFGKLGKTLKGALGAVGVGLSLGAITNQLQAATKAAAADAKSQGLLANALRNTVGATNDQIASVETSISKMEGLAAVADDEIRPIFSQLTRVTGDLGQATSLTNLALDIAADTGRDLGSVAIALGKAYQGNTTSLARLGINVKGVSDPMAVLEKQFAGAAEAAAELDPYQRLEIVFGNLQEQIGTALLPYLNELADYFTSAEGQDKLKQFASDVADIATSVIDLADSLQLSGILDDLAILIERFAALSKLNFGKLAEQDANAGMNAYVELYETNRKAYDEKIAFLKRVKGDQAAAVVADIESFVKKNRGATGQGGSVLDSYFGSTGLRGGLGTGIKITGATGGLGGGGSSGLTAAQKAAAAASKAAADAIKKATDAANDQADAYIKAAEAAADLMSATRKMVGEFTNLFKVTPELGAFESQAVDAFSNIFDTIDSALADGVVLSGAASALREYAASESKTLQAIGKQRDVLAGKVDVARSITSGVMGLVGITDLLETTSKSVTETVSTIINGISVATTKTFDVVSSGGLVDNFQKLVDKTKLFAKNLVDLKKLGLNKQLFAQLVNAGADAGGATAQALVDGGKDTIQALNGLYNELALSAGDIAATATDTLYEVGQQVVSNGFIEGLLSQDTALQRAAQTLADAFASTFQSQLQLAVDAVLPNQGGMIDQVAAVTSMGGSVAGGRTFNMASTGKATIFNVNVSAGVVTDPNGLARTVIDSVKKYERSNGSVWVAA
jgi:hypothetical protein